MKKVSKRILALLLTVLMITSCLPLSVFAVETTSTSTSADETPVDNSVVIGDSSLFDSVVEAQPKDELPNTPFDDGMGNTFSLEKSVLGYKDPINFKVTVNEKYTGAWIGLYFLGDEYIHGKNYQSYFWVKNASKDGYTTYQSYDTDIIGGDNIVPDKSGGYNGYGAENPTPGTYQLVLFADGGSTVLNAQQFTILPADNMYGSATVVTDKTAYGFGDAVTVTANTGDNSNLKAALYKTNGDASFVSSSFKTEYALSSGETTFNLQEKLSTGTLAPGAYTLFIVSNRDGNTDNRRPYAFYNFTVDYINTNKDIYECGEDIVVEVSGVDTSDTASWIGLYPLGKENADLSNYAYWYGINSTDGTQYTGKPTVLQDQNYEPVADIPNVLPAGEYALRLFSQSTPTWSYHTAATTITIIPTKPHAPKSAAYKVYDKTDGFANGKVAVQVADEDHDIYKGIDMVMYWADNNGRLEGYNSLAPFTGDGIVKTSDMVSHTIIPEGATKLHIHTSLQGIESDGYYEIDLASKNIATYDLGETTDYSEFASVTDTHINTPESMGEYAETNAGNNTHFKQMLEDVKLNASNSTGIFIAGDIADQGGSNPEQYQEFNRIYNEAGGLSSLPQIYVARGNHDVSKKNFMNFAKADPINNIDDSIDSIEDNSYWDSTVGRRIAVFNDADNASPDYHEKWVDGYHHIFLGGVQGTGKDSCEVTLGDYQINWLNNLLEKDKKDNPEKPVFIYLHQPMENTVSGSSTAQTYYGVTDQTKLQAVLSKYNNVIIFDGHTHWELNSANNMFAGGYAGYTNGGTTDPVMNEYPIGVAFNAASVGYLWTDYYGCDVGVEGSQGYYVRVYDDKVVVLGRDFVNNTYVPSAMYVVDLYDDTEFSVEDIEINLYEDSTYANKTTNAPITGVNAEGLTLTYESLNKDIVTVDKNTGALTAVGSGKAEIVVSALADDTHVVTRKYMTVTVRNNAEDVLGEPVDLGDFSAYIKSLTKNPDVINDDRYLRLSSTEAAQNADGGSVRYSKFNEKYAAATALDINKRDKVKDQFWDFELQDDGTYVIYNTYTNVSHDNSVAAGGSGGYVHAYALSGGGEAYDELTSTYVLVEPTGDGKGFTRAERDDYLKGDRADYFKWYIFRDSAGQYYLKCKATGKFANLWYSKYSDKFNYGSLDDFRVDESEYNKYAFDLEKIEATENIKMNIFDYGSYITDVEDDDKILDFVRPTQKDGKDYEYKYVDSSTDAPGYTSDRPVMNSSLNDAGYPVASEIYDTNIGTTKTKTGSLQYLFDEDMTYVAKPEDTEEGLSVNEYAGGEYTSVRYGIGDGSSTGLFRKDESTGLYSYRGNENAAYFDTSKFFSTGKYVPVFGENFQLYDYKIRTYDEWYNKEKAGASTVTVTELQNPGTDEAENDGHSIYLGVLEANSDGTPNYENISTNRFGVNNLMAYRGVAQNGQFLPFNLGHAMSPNYDTGSFDSQGSDDDNTAQNYPYLPAYYNDQNVVSEDAINKTNKTNMWFGMNFEFDFQQKTGGKVNDSDDMIFKFIGDDDVWVYVDDVLVLDIGGIHAANYGEINFATGEVIHPMTTKHYHYEKMSLLDKYITAYYDAITDSSSSLHSEALNAVKNAGATEGAQKEAIRNYLVRTDGETAGDFNADGTFVDGTVHTMKFYYLERGAGVSTCNVSFNMEPIPTSVVDLENQVVRQADGVDLSDRDDDDYSFQIIGYKTDAAGNYGAALSDKEVFTYNLVDTKTGELIEENLTVAQNGTFTLKGGQRAVFNMEIETAYTFTEIKRADQRFIPTAKINGTKVNLSLAYSVQTMMIEEGQTYDIDFINELTPTTVTLKYYDRIMEDGKPTDISSKAKAVSYDYYGAEVEYTDDGSAISNSAELINDASIKMGLDYTGNVLDEYKLPTSTEKMANDLKDLVNYHTGANYIYTEYHTNQYGYTQDEGGYFADGTDGDGEKWVTVDSDNNAIKVWLFNKPKKYTVNTYGVVDDETADSLEELSDGKWINTSAPSAKKATAYYNQRMGQKPTTESSDDTTNYLKKYGLDGYTGVTATTNETATTGRGTTVKFLYWAFDEEGTQIASTNPDYNYRITSSTDLYAVYGAADTATASGVSLRENGYDLYSDDNGVSRIRLNSVLNPYGDYADRGKTKISDVAILYIDMTGVEEKKVADEVKDLQPQLTRLLNDGYALSGTVNLTTVSGTTKVNGFSYDVVDKPTNSSQVYLTSKNRVQFSTSFKKAQYDSLNLVAVAAICVDGNWIITNNCIDFKSAN